MRRRKQATKVQNPQPPIIAKKECTEYVCIKNQATKGETPEPSWRIANGNVDLRTTASKEETRKCVQQKGKTICCKRFPFWLWAECPSHQPASTESLS